MPAEIEPIKVLDHGFVRLVDFMGSDLSVVRAARVSYAAAWRAGDDEGSDDRLLKYLYRNNHTTPFEAVVFTFEVKAPIFVLRQWHRHRTWSYNELSGRYRELEPHFYVPAPAVIGSQDQKNKQGRSISDAIDLGLRERQTDSYAAACREAFNLYEDLLRGGWPRELARAVLPVSTYSHMFATVNLLNLMKFLSLRDDDHAQYEIRQYAMTLEDLAKSVVPKCLSARKLYKVKGTP